MFLRPCGSKRAELERNVQRSMFNVLAFNVAKIRINFETAKVFPIY